MGVPTASPGGMCLGWWRSWSERQLFEAGRLGQAVDEVEGLHGLARGALDEVVLDPDRDDPAGSLVEPDVDEHVVAAGRVLGRRRRGHDADERLVRVRRRVELVEVRL